MAELKFAKSVVYKINVNISTLRIIDHLVVRLGCSLKLFVDLMFESVHSKQHRSLPLSLLAKPLG